MLRYLKTLLSLCLLSALGSQVAATDFDNHGAFIWGGAKVQGLNMSNDLRSIDVAVPLPSLPFMPKLSYHRQAYEARSNFGGWENGGARSVKASLPFGLTLEVGNRINSLGADESEFVGLTFNYSNLQDHHNRVHYARLEANRMRSNSVMSGESEFGIRFWSAATPLVYGIALGLLLDEGSSSTQRSNSAVVDNGSDNDTANSGGDNTPPPQPDEYGWLEVWSDEFDGTELDENNWSTNDSYLRGECWGYGNNEQQCYTPREQNVSVSGGFLELTGLKENYSNKNYTSGRIHSRGKQDFKYGRFEASIQLPGIRGTWPAFWMLPTQEVDQPNPFDTGGIYGTWPRSGEIDIMESENGSNNEIINALHFWNPDGGGHIYHDDRSLAATTTFNTYRVDWHDDEITWFLNGNETFSLNRNMWNGGPQSVGTSDNAPFDQEFHMILNLALGGTLGGTLFPSDWGPDGHKMLVDYVRVYECIDGPSGCKQ